MFHRLQPSSEICRINVRIEKHEATAAADILAAEVPEKVRFALPGLPQDGQVFDHLLSGRCNTPPNVVWIFGDAVRTATNG